MCSHPDCKRRLIMEATEVDDAAAIGEAAHIVARAQRGPRGEAPIAPGGLNRYDNLILLCAHHHRMIDRQPRTNRVEDLRAWKAEHETWVETRTSGALRDVPWTAIVQEEGRRIDMAEAAGALGPGNAAARLIELRSNVERDGWADCAARELRETEVAMLTTSAEERRFAVFSLGRIPLAAQLGWLLGDRARVALFQFDRDRGSWQWDERAAETAPVTWRCAESEGGPREEAAIRVSLSAEVRPRTARRGIEIDIRAAEPSLRWLRRREQLTELARVYEQALGAARERGCRRIHLFYAGPAAGAIQFGRAYNARMNPPLDVYDYRAGTGYERALTLNGE